MLFELWEFMGAMEQNTLNSIYKYIFYSHLYVYIYVYTLCVFVCPLDTGRKLGVQQDFQKSSRVVLGMFYVRSECGLFQGQVHVSSFDS